MWSFMGQVTSISSLFLKPILLFFTVSNVLTTVVGYCFAHSHNCAVNSTANVIACCQVYKSVCAEFDTKKLSKNSISMVFFYSFIRYRLVYDLYSKIIRFLSSFTSDFPNLNWKLLFPMCFHPFFFAVFAIFLFVCSFKLK